MPRVLVPVTFGCEANIIANANSKYHKVMVISRTTVRTSTVAFEADDANMSSMELIFYILDGGDKDLEFAVSMIDQNVVVTNQSIRRTDGDQYRRFLHTAIRIIFINDELFGWVQKYCKSLYSTIRYIIWCQ
jgi:hypothetical protein